MNIVRKSHAEFKKLSLNKASYAHIKQDDIFIVFKDKIQGAKVEYAVEVERAGLITVPLMTDIRSFYVSDSMVKYLKEFTRIDHYRNNESEAGKRERAKADTVIVYTKKGTFVQSVYSVNGTRINCADIEALYK